MNILDAFYHTVHDAPGGCESLAPRMGMTAPILRNKADPNKDHNKPMLMDADKLMALTGDYRILQALAMSHSHVCIKVDNDTPASDLAILDLITQVWQSNGDVGKAVNDALADGKVEQHELEQVKGAIHRTQTALNAMLKRLEDMAEK